MSVSEVGSAAEVIVSEFDLTGSVKQIGKVLEPGDHFVGIGSEFSLAELRRSFDHRFRVVATSDQHFGELLDSGDHVRMIGSVQSLGQREELLRRFEREIPLFASQIKFRQATEHRK